MSKNGDGVRNRKWLEWEASGDKQFFRKTALTTNCTFVGLGTKYRAEFDRVVADGEQHIFFTDRVNIPDIKVIPGTQKIYQIQGNLEDPG